MVWHEPTPWSKLGPHCPGEELSAYYQSIPAYYPSSPATPILSIVIFYLISHHHREFRRS
jgi:hypothetical protein